MLSKPIVSQEMIMTGNKNGLGKAIEEWVVTARKLEIEKASNAETMKHFNNLVDLVKLKTGLNITLNVVSDSFTCAAAVSSKMWLNNHNGTKYSSNNLNYDQAEALILKGSVDLEKAVVSGMYTDMVVFNIYVTTGLLSDSLGFTPEETTAILLHEIGHAYKAVSHIGEYVRLNYYLTEGIEILQGKRTNKYNFEVLTHKYILENIPEDQRDDFVNNPNEGTIRRAILSSYKRSSRGHLFDGGLTSKRRNEQMADMYVTRLGYGRALALALSRMDKYYPGSQGRGESTWFADTLTTIALLGAAPLVAMAVMLVDPLEDKNTYTNYDDNMERLFKIRRDLIQQSKILKSYIDINNLINDINVIDEVIKEYSSKRTVFDSVVTILRPSIRKMEQNAVNEEKLEALLNNDLFLNALKLKNL